MTTTRDPMTIRAEVDDLVRQIRRAYPDALGVIRQIRADALGEGTTWPDWCWTPMAATVAYLNTRAGQPQEIAAVHAITTWRLDRVVLAVEDDAVHAALNDLVDQGLLGPRAGPTAWREIPTQVVDDAASRLPTWCPYLALPEQMHHVYRGLWVHLEADTNTARRELRLLIDRDGTRTGLRTLIIYLDRPTLGRAVDDMLANSWAGASGTRGANLTGLPVAGPADATGHLIHSILPVLLGALHPSWIYAHPGTPGATIHRPDPTSSPATATAVWTQHPAGPRAV